MMEILDFTINSIHFLVEQDDESNEITKEDLITRKVLSLAFFSNETYRALHVANYSSCKSNR